MLAANPKGLFHVRDELSGWILGFDRYSKGGERSFWVEAYGGDTFTIDRVKAGGSIRIPHLSISVFGGVQPDRLTTLLLSGDDDGLPARFIWAWPDPLPPRRPTATVSDGPVRAAMRRLAALRPGRSETGDHPILMRLDGPASDTFQQWREEHDVSAKATAGMVESAWGKLPGILLRLAMVLELSAWAIGPTGAPEPTNVSKASLLRAAVLVDDYIKPMAERVYSDAAMPVNERHASGLARYIAYGKHDQVNVRVLSRNRCVPGLNDPATVAAAIKILVEAGWLRPDDTPTGGRPRGDYTVNPRVRDLVERSHG
jgi:putative DNA primase/helicase